MNYRVKIFLPLFLIGVFNAQSMEIKNLVHPSVATTKEQAKPSVNNLQQFTSHLLKNLNANSLQKTAPFLTQFIDLKDHFIKSVETQDDTDLCKFLEITQIDSKIRMDLEGTTLAQYAAHFKLARVCQHYNIKSGKPAKN